MTLKEKQFIKITAQTLNPAEGVRRAYDLGAKGGLKDKKHKDNTTYVMAKENLSKPHIQKGLREEMEDKGVDNTLITNITKRNLKQNKNIPASNQIIDIYHKIKGNYAPEKKITMNITPDNVNKLIDAKLNELRQLQEKSPAIK